MYKLTKHNLPTTTVQATMYTKHRSTVQLFLKHALYTGTHLHPPRPVGTEGRDVSIQLDVPRVHSMYNTRQRTNCTKLLVRSVLNCIQPNLTEGKNRKTEQTVQPTRTKPSKRKERRSRATRKASTVHSGAQQSRRDCAQHPVKHHAVKPT